jgi:hypothetical protein
MLLMAAGVVILEGQADDDGWIYCSVDWHNQM